MPDMTFNVTAAAESATRVRIKARSFEMIVDEPPPMGGQDQGPTPVEYLLAASVGCINVILHMIAKERGIEIRDVRFHAEGPLNPARLMGSNTEDRTGFKKIHLKIEVDSPAPRELIQDLLEAVEQRCPVSDNLSNPTPIALELENPA